MIRQAADNSTALLIPLYLSFLNETVRTIQPTDVGLLGVSFNLSVALAAPLLGRLSDQHGRKPLIVAGLLIGAVTAQVYPFTSTLLVIALTLMMEGLGTAAEVPATLGFLADSSKTSPSLRARLMAIYEIASVASLAGGAFMGGYLWDHLGLIGFRLVSVVYVCGMLAAWLGIKETKVIQTDRESLLPYLRVMTDRRVWGLIPSLMAVSIMVGAWISQSAFLMSGTQRDPRQFLIGGFSGSEIGLGIAIVVLVFAGGAYTWGVLSARLQKAVIMVCALVGAYGVLAIVYLVNHMQEPSAIQFGVELLLAVSFLAAIFVASGFSPIALSYVADLSKIIKVEAGFLMGGYALVLGIGRIIGAWLGGLFADWAGIDGLVLMSVFLVSLGVLSLVLLIRVEASETRSLPTI